MISSDINIGDRPVRRHFNGIIFSTMAFMALVLLLAMLYLHIQKPSIAPAQTPPSNVQPAPSTQPQ
jgi:hypothetical protein